MRHLLLSFSLEHLLALRVFHGLKTFGLLVHSLAVHCIMVLLFSQLFKSLGRQVVSRSEHLLLVLLADVNPSINCALVDDNTLFSLGIMISVDNGPLIKVFILGVLRPHKIWYFV